MGSAVDLDMSERLVEVEVPSDQGTGTIRAYVPCTLTSLSMERRADVQMIRLSLPVDLLRTIMVLKDWNIVSSSRLSQTHRQSGDGS